MNIAAIASLILVFFVIGCSVNPHTSVPLVWKPTSDLYGFNTSNFSKIYGKKFMVRKFTDERQNPNEIGKYIENENNLAVTTKDNVGGWCSQRFTNLLEQYGFKISGENPDLVINGQILHFYVTEDKLYKANVGIKITVIGSSGKTLWQGIASGNSKRFGRSYSLENYYESLSDAYLEAIHGLLKDEKFIHALSTS